MHRIIGVLLVFCIILVVIVIGDTMLILELLKQ